VGLGTWFCKIFTIGTIAGDGGFGDPSAGESATGDGQGNDSDGGPGGAGTTSGGGDPSNDLEALALMLLEALMKSVA
jgi:hypothetical protein